MLHSQGACSLEFVHHGGGSSILRNIADCMEYLVVA